MPSTSLKQHNFMEAVAHNPSFAKKAGVPQSVGKDFSQADKRKSFGKGSGSRADIQSINSPKTNHGEMAIMKKGGDIMASKMNPGFMAMIAKKKGMSKMAGGGMPMKDGKPAFIGDGKGMKHGGATKKMASGGMTSMGSVKTASPSKDGIAEKGKTKGMMPKMAGSKPLGMKNGGKVR